jgi:hypothetical protein
MTAMLCKNAPIRDRLNDELYIGEVLVEGIRIKAVARGRTQIATENAAEIMKHGGMRRDARAAAD